MAGLGTILSIIALVTLVAPGSSGVESSPRDEQVTIAALYINTPTGERHREGIHEAWQNHPMKPHVLIRDFYYESEQQGFTQLRELITQEQVDIVLGPTESGVYVRAWEQRTELSQHQIPVISSLVTANVPNAPRGWFFRTNVDVRRRSRAIYDYLNKYWIRSIGVLYANTEFGRRSEGAFHEQLNAIQKEHYTSFPFENAQDTRFEIKQILDSRPEALGIFGEREDIEIINDSLICMNRSSSPYRPIMFTNLDARELSGNVNDLHFVAVTGQGVAANGQDLGSSANFDDVKALSYDTALLVLNELDRMRKQQHPLRSNRERFRDGFVNILNGEVGHEGTKTGMKFADYENSADLKVFHLDGGNLVEKSLDIVGLDDKLRAKYDLIFDRYGMMPLVCFTIVIVVPFAMSVFDLKRWYGRSWLGLFNKPYFYLLVVVNMVLCIGLFIVLGETGQVRYDSVVMALIIAITPPTFLKSTVLELPTGQSIGLARLYDKFLLWINDKLMVARYQMLSRRVNILAYYNSLAGMKSMLLEVFENASNEKQQGRLIAELEESLQKATSHFQRRSICARRLIRQFEWEELRQRGFVPEFIDENEDPAAKTRILARRFVREPESLQKLRDEIERRVKMADETTRGFYTRKMSEAMTSWDRVFYEVQFARFMWGYDEQRFEKEGILKPKKGDAMTDISEKRVSCDEPTL